MAKSKNKEMAPANVEANSGILTGSSSTATLAKPAGNGISLQPIHNLSEHFPASAEQEVAFSFSAPKAKSVKVAGDFNHWNPEAAPLKKKDNGEWTTRMKLRHGKYEYLFVVDGEWTSDPRTSHTHPNPYGGVNSILTVP